jgi:RND family efflux transporter MFP subunit
VAFAFLTILADARPLPAQQGSLDLDETVPTLVEVGQVERDDVAATSQFVATVVPTRRSIVGAAVDGRVESYLFDEDHPDRKLTHVTAGQELAQLKTDTIEHELGAAQAQLALNQQQLAELRNGSRPEEVAAAQAQLRRAEAARQYATARYNRLEKLFEANSSISLDELEGARAQVAQAEQTCVEALAKYDLAVAGPREEQIAQAEARVKSQQETVQLLEAMLRKYTVRAPFDGYVVAEFTELGAWLSAGDPVAEVIQLVPMEVEAALPEKHIPDVDIGDAAEVRLTVLPGQVLTGRVQRIIPQADVRSRTFPIRIRLDDEVRPETHHVMAGMLGHVMLSLHSADSVTLVPKDALVLNGDQRSVVVVERLARPTAKGALGVARLVPVELGISRGSTIQIRGDVRVGDLVVTRGNERLEPNQPLVWKESPQIQRPVPPVGDAARSLSVR